MVKLEESVNNNQPVQRNVKSISKNEKEFSGKNSALDTTGPNETSIIIAVMGEAKYFQKWYTTINKASNLSNDSMLKRKTNRRAVTLLYGSFDAPINTSLYSKRNELVNSIDCRSIYIPKTTWTEGRNLLAQEIRLDDERLNKKYDFWVFVDDDVRLSLYGQKTSDDGQGFGSFIDYLADETPPNATTVSASTYQRGVEAVTTQDALLAAFPRKFVPYFLPYVTLEPRESQWNRQACLFCVMIRCFKSSAVFVGNVFAVNEKHRPYARGIDKTVIFRSLQRNFNRFKFDVEPCRNLDLGKQFRDRIGPFATSAELNKQIPPLDYATCAPLLNRFSDWEASILGQGYGKRQADSAARTEEHTTDIVFKIRITEILSGDTFFYKHVNQEEADIIENGLEHLVESISDPCDVKVGKLVAANAWNAWYRAEITEKLGRKVKVKLIDYGSVTTIHADTQCRPLDNLLEIIGLEKIPALAKEAQLYLTKVPNVTESVGIEAAAFLQRAGSGKDIMARLDGTSGDKDLVTLYESDSDALSINEKMVSEGLAFINYDESVVRFVKAVISAQEIA